MSIVYFIVGLGLLIFIHELGHFLVAKACGIRVEEFSLGFGPRLMGFKKGETDYRLSLLPLGGYVKLWGEEPEGPLQPINDPHSFSAQPLPKRMSVVFAGPLMNLLLALCLLPIVFWVGRSEYVFMNEAPILYGVKKGSPAEKAGFQKGERILQIEGQNTSNWEEALKQILINPNRELSFQVRDLSGDSVLRRVRVEGLQEGRMGFVGIEPALFIGNDPVIDQISPHSPAEAAGLQPRDKILAINNKPIHTWEEMSEAIGASAGQPIRLELLRTGGERLQKTATPEFNDPLKKWILGMSKEIPEGLFTKKHYGFISGLQRGIQEYGKLTGLTWEVLKKLLSFQLSYKALGGPIQIAQASAKAAESGFGDFLYFLAFLSIQLGIMNLLPIPVLDGGHLLFMSYEAIRRKPLPAKQRLVAQQVGMVLMLSLMVLVTFNDLDHWLGIRKIFLKWFGG